MYVAGILIVAAAIALLEIPPLKRERRSRELAVFSALLAASTALAAVQTLHVRLPNPLEWIHSLFNPINQWIEYML